MNTVVVRSGVKATDAGVIPDDWDVKRIGDFLGFFSGKAHEPFVVTHGPYVVVNSKFVSSDGRVRKFCTENLLPARTGDILMVMSDLPNGRALAKCFLVDRDDFYAVNQRVCILRARRDDPRYLRYALNRNQYFMAFDDGVQQTHLLNAPIKNCPVALPPIREQSAIADALCDVDLLISSLERLIAKKTAMKTGMRLRLLSGHTRLPGYESPWRTVLLGDVLTVRHGKSQKAVESSTGSVPILATGGQIGWASSALYSKPSVLIGRKGTIDRPQFQSKPFWTVDTLFYTEIGPLADPRYLYFVFLTVDWRSMNEASGVPSLSSRRVEGVEVQLPDFAEQCAIRDVLDDAESEVAVLATRLAKAQVIRRGMLQQLLTGKTRLPVEVAS